MPSTFRNMRLPTQISLGALLSIIVIFFILIFSIAKLLEQKLNEIITDHQHTEAKLVANQLESEYFLINKSLTRLTTLMEQSLAGRVKEQNGRYTLDDQPISSNLATLTSIQNASDTDIVLLENRSGQLQVLTSSNLDIPVGTRVDRTSSDTSKPIKLFINKKPYITKAVPLNGTSSLYVGAFIPLDVVYASMTRRLNEVKFGKQGYIYVTDTGQHKGDILIHPSIRNSNLFELYPDLSEDFDKLYRSNSGVTYYTAKLKGTDKKERETKAIFQHVDGWDWVAVVKTYTDEYREEVMWVVWLVTAICIAGATILTVILWLLVMKNLSALNSIVQGVKEIGSGNLAHRFQNKVSHNSRNETHILQLAVEHMRDDLLGLVHAVQNTSSQLAESANQISQANTRLIDSANESAGASLEVASSIQQVSASTEEVANSSVAVSTQSNAVHDVTEKGYTAVQQVEKTVGNLSDSFERAAQTISDVENSTENIGNVVNVINEIAEQTNLLALNAAIEAARAGEQGRGFAVVADEVRVLAQRTQQSTEEIQEVVSRLQQGSRSAVDIMNNGRDEVTLSVKQASDAGDLLKQIHQSMNLVAEGIANVAASTEEQSVAAVQILGNSEALHRSAETTLTEVQFSQQQSQQISHLTNELTQQLAKFKL